MRFTASDQNPGVVLPLESRPDIAAAVGTIVALFSVIEDHVPNLLTFVTGMDGYDALAVAGTIRGFKNRLEIFDNIGKMKDEGSWERVILSHYRGLFEQANTIRNKYAHATYAGGDDGNLTLLTGVRGRNRASQKLTIESITKDIEALRQISGAFVILLDLKWVPTELHIKLPPQARG